MTVNERDYGLVIGINSYLGLRNLKGAAQDAADFTAWLCDPDGGALPRENVRTLIGSRDPNHTDDPFHPTIEHIDAALHDLITLCRSQQGHRLYFYFAGHGIGNTPNDVAMLLANAQSGYLNNNIGLRAYHNRLHDCALFNELIFFLDCCREFNEPVITRGPALSLPRDEERASQVSTMVMFATGYGTRAFEPASQSNDGRGLLSQALLEGLTGRAAKDGAVTAERLGQYLRRRVPKLAVQRGLEQIPYAEVTNPDLLICTVAKPRRWVRQQPAQDLPPVLQVTSLPVEQLVTGDLITALLRLARKIDHSGRSVQQSVELLTTSVARPVTDLAAETGLPAVTIQRLLKAYQEGFVPSIKAGGSSEHKSLLFTLIAHSSWSWHDVPNSVLYGEVVETARDAIRNALGAARLLGERKVRWEFEGALRRALGVLAQVDDALLVFDAKDQLAAESAPAPHLRALVTQWLQAPTLADRIHGSARSRYVNMPDSVSIQTLLVELKQGQILARIISFHQVEGKAPQSLIESLRSAVETGAQIAAIFAGGRERGDATSLSEAVGAITALCEKIEQRGFVDNKLSPDTSAARNQRELRTPSGVAMRSQYERLYQWLMNIGPDHEFRRLVRSLLPKVQDLNQLPLSPDTISRARFLNHIQDIERLDDLEELLLSFYPGRRPE